MKSQQVKRVMDIIGSLMGLILVSPIILVISLMVYLTMGRPIFFKQVRPGLYGKPFTIYKFRTMLDLRDKNGNLLPDEKRLTPFGNLLRKFSIDELPELWNVLKGDMSLVGPRPLLIEYMPYFTEHEKLRFTLKPGITGLAQVNGRNFMSWSARFENDIKYINNWNIRLDISILLITIKKTLLKEGFVENPNSIMLNFDEERRLVKPSDIENNLNKQHK